MIINKKRLYLSRLLILFTIQIYKRQREFRKTNIIFRELENREEAIQKC
ncbi:hypothetical protein LMG8526HA_00482 [Lactococcus lactis]|nr:hypothetical protein [Lactococcus lactis]